MILTQENINYIINDINYRGIIDEELGDELVDHICSIVEQKMTDGQRFIEAYDSTIAEFGNDSKMLNLQNQIVEYSNHNTPTMIRNYFKIAFRNLTKHKFYSAINIIGLSIGVACTLLIYLFVSNELSYDKFHSNSDRIYRIVRHGNFGGNEFHYPVTPAPLANGLITELPEIKNAVRFRTQGTYLVKKQGSEQNFKERGLAFTDSTFFDIFSFPLQEGRNETALNRPYTIAISKTMADKYFPNESALGQTLILDGDQSFEVTAVFSDIPENSHLQFDFLMSLSTLDESLNTNWLSNNFFTYIEANEGVSLKTLYEKIGELYQRKAEPALQEYMGFSIEEFLAAGNTISLELQPIADVYLTSDFIFDIAPMGSEENVYLFTAIAIFILGLACINFMNLSTARSANRAKEVGIRKALGSYKAHLVRQFLMESVIMSLIAYFIGLVLVATALPFFNQLSGKALTLPVSDISFLIIILGAGLITGILAGVYPAFFLSAFKPINTLKGKLALGSGNSTLRSALVVFQFFISILLIIGTIAIHRQLEFIQNKKLGFQKEQVVLVNDPYMLGDSRESFKKEIEQLSDVMSASYSGFIPINGYNRSDNTYWVKGVSPDETNTVSTQMWGVDEDYIETMGMEIVEGRNLSKDIASDSNAIVLNEEAMRRFGFQDLNDKWIQNYFYDPNTGSMNTDVYVDYKVVGVVKNFHFESMKQSIGPLALRLGKSSGVLSVRLSTTEYGSIIEQIEDRWGKFGAGLPFNYHFLDDRFNRMYQEESRLGTVFGVFAGLAIFIGCLGLFALATFMAEQRIKEIGIRKVLGASVNGIVVMLSKQFSKLVIISFLLAAPTSWWLLSTWLSNYNYHISMGIDLFLISGIFAFVIAWLTVGYQSIRAALSNPVDSLKNE